MAIQPKSRSSTTGHSKPLDFIQPRDTKRAKKARASSYTRFVAKLRLFLPIGALVVILSLFLWPLLGGERLKTMLLKNAPDLVIQNLHFTGLDSKNEAYSLSAAKATRPGGVPNVYDLQKPEGEITLDSGAWVAGKAQYGRYDQDNHQLWLGGNVQLFHDQGYEFTTDEAQVDLNDYNAWGAKPVLIQGDFGEIRGQGFRMLDSGKVMVVTGPGKAILSLHGGTPSDKPAIKKK